MFEGIVALATVPFNVSGQSRSLDLHAPFAWRNGTVERLKCLCEIPKGRIAMAKSTKSKGSGNDTLDKIAKAAMSREMLGAGLAAAAAAISASPAARRKIRDAGLDAADSASQAATSVMSSASKLGALIAEAVADAAQRVMSGKWSDDDSGSSSSGSSGSSGRGGRSSASGTRRAA